jgi:DNA polymerase I-like protein with 3'-5' exonuclease and polymerase domains
MITEQIIQGGTQPYVGLKELVFKYCGIMLDKSEQRSFKMGAQLTESQQKYAIQDILYLPEIMRKQKAKIKLIDLQNTVDIEMKVIPAVAWLELSGINVDLKKLDEIKIKVLEQKNKAGKFLIHELTREQIEITPDTTQEKASEKPKTLTIIPNLNSPKSLLETLKAKGYDKLEGTGKQELGKYKGDELITNLILYRQAEKLLSGFIAGFYETQVKKDGKIEIKSPKYPHPITKRVHGEFNQYGALSGIFTSSKPNLQQQPSRYREWRQIYTAAPGNKIVACDLSQIELRIIGQHAKEPKYIQAYKANLDLHKETATQMFNVPLESVTKQQREIAKTINFGLNYGMGAQALKESLKINADIEVTLEEAQKLKQTFQRLYPHVTKYLNKAGEEEFQKGEIRTLAGRICKTRNPNKKEEDYKIKNKGKNLPVQGLCADILKIAMGNLFLILESREIKLINSVHDELVFECKVEKADEVPAIVKTEMEKAGNLFLKDLPCIAEVTIADYWNKE